MIDWIIRAARRFVCAVLGHNYFVLRRISMAVRKVGCKRCGRCWGMHDEARVFVEWDDELEALHSDGGDLYRKVD